MNTRELADKILLQEKRISDLELAYKELQVLKDKLKALAPDRCDWCGQVLKS